MFSVIGIKSRVFAYITRPVSKAQARRDLLDVKISHIYTSNRGNYGSPRITRELHASGISCSANTVSNRMMAMNLQAKHKRKYKVTTDSKHSLTVSDNVLARDFTTTGINQKYVGDITYIRTDEGWLYLAVVIDLYSRAVIGWSMSKRLKKALVCEALVMALWRRGFPRGVIMHTDRGSQYCSSDYQKLLYISGLTSSMSRKGDCWDNSIAESFFKTLKVELVYNCRFATREQAREEIFNYIESYYNRKRRHSAIDYRAPFDVESDSLASW